jgi:hypothetical protein
MDLGKMAYEDGRWIELGQDCIQWQAMVATDIEPSGCTTTELVMGNLTKLNKFLNVLQRSQPFHVIRFHMLILY